jgi:hypothetical protein
MIYILEVSYRIIQDNILVPPGLDQKGLIIEFIFKIFFFMILTNYLRAAFGDPGYVHKMKLVDENFLY